MSDLHQLTVSNVLAVLIMKLVNVIDAMELDH